MPSEEKIIPVKVALRTRPLIDREIGENECVSFIKQANQVVIGDEQNKKAFTYDYVFDQNSAQEEVYKGAVLPLIEGIFKGYNGTVLAYGQTGSGKTHTMGSAHCVSQSSVNDSSSGIIPRVITDLFNGISERKDTAFVVKVWYAEIYMEEVKDLLAADESRHISMQIRETAEGSIHIAGITEKEVQSPVETLSYMEQGNSCRATGSTAMNKTSSRSHAIFTIVVEARSNSAPEDFTTSKFHLVDLAGSERIKKTKAQGDRMQEGIKINGGLLALGNVISALGDQLEHIPYRDSKLTRLLQDSLGGNSLTVMIACISPAHGSCEETVNTCRYADRARKIKNKAVINRDPQTAELCVLRKENQRLRIQLMQANGEGVSAAEAERKKLLESYDRLRDEYQKLFLSNCNLLQKSTEGEAMRNELRNKLYELQKLARDCDLDDTHNLSLAEHALEDEQALRDAVHNLRELRSQLLQYELDEDRITKDVKSLTSNEFNDLDMSDDVIEPEDDVPGGSANDATSGGGGDAATGNLDNSHHLRSVEMCSQLRELNKALAFKEELARKMSSSDENLGVLRAQYEEQLQKLDQEIEKLNKEKNALNKQLELAKKNNDASKISEQRRQRLLALEIQLKDLQKEKREKEKIAKLKAQSDQKIVKLNSEIQNIKSSRVKLLRQMKDEGAKYENLRKQKDREVKQLQAKDRKWQVEMAKMERDFNKQKTVLRRKTEEAAASNRRLNDALQKQRSAAKMQAGRVSSRQQNTTAKWKGLIEEHLELAVRQVEAERHEVALSEEVDMLRKEVKKLDGSENSNKSKRQTLLATEMREKQKELEDLNNELELKVMQINGLQTQLSDAKDASTKMQSRWLAISSIGEARTIIKHLFSLLTESKVSEEQIRMEANRAQKDLEQSRVEIQQNRNNHGDELGNIEAEYSEKLVVLTKQLTEVNNHDATYSATDREDDLKSQIQIQADLIQTLNNQVETLRAENKRQLQNIAKLSAAEEAKTSERKAVVAESELASTSGIKPPSLKTKAPPPANGFKQPPVQTKRSKIEPKTSVFAGDAKPAEIAKVAEKPLVKKEKAGGVNGSAQSKEKIEAAGKWKPLQKARAASGDSKAGPAASKRKSDSEQEAKRAKPELTEKEKIEERLRKLEEYRARKQQKKEQNRSGGGGTHNRDTGKTDGFKKPKTASKRPLGKTGNDEDHLLFSSDDEFGDIDESSDYELESEDACSDYFPTPKAIRRRKGCLCTKGSCKNCACATKGRSCREACKCAAGVCTNRHSAENEAPGSDEEGTEDEEDETTSAESSKMMNETYTTSEQSTLQPTVSQVCDSTFTLNPDDNDSNLSPMVTVVHTTDVIKGTPYYQRKSMFLPASGSDQNSPVLMETAAATDQSDSKYKPCYFSSPLTGCENQTRRQSAKDDAEPATIVEKKRRLH